MDKYSGTLGLSGQRETAIALDGDHRGICKFAEPNSTYQQVEDDLAAMVEEALQSPSKERPRTPTVRSPTCKCRKILNERSRLGLNILHA